MYGNMCSEVWSTWNSFKIFHIRAILWLTNLFVILPLSYTIKTSISSLVEVLLAHLTAWILYYLMFERYQVWRVSEHIVYKGKDMSQILMSSDLRLGISITKTELSGVAFISVERKDRSIANLTRISNFYGYGFKTTTWSYKTHNSARSSTTRFRVKVQEELTGGCEILYWTTLDEYFVEHTNIPHGI